MSAWFEVAIVHCLVFVNGFFAMAEMAVVNSRRIRLQQMADEGNRKAAQALALAEDPGRLLSAVQVARHLGLQVVTLSAMSPDNPLRGGGDLNIHLACRTYGEAETGHAAVLHHWMDRIAGEGR